MTLLRVKPTWAINGHRLRLSGGEMGAGHVSELCSAVLDPTFRPTHVGGPRVLTQGEEGGKCVRAAEAVVACMFPKRPIRFSRATVNHVTYLIQAIEAAWQVFRVNAAAWPIIRVTAAAWQVCRAVCLQPLRL